jgi:diguanylate cyclase (GGDEF)-like protein/PAS domain S-box-containing protein
MSLNTTYLYKDIFEQFSAGALIIDELGTILNVNDAYCQLSGFHLRDVIGNNVDSFLESAYQQNENWQGEVYIKRKKEDDILQWLYASPINGSVGTDQYTILIIRDFHITGFDPLTKLPNRFLLPQALNKSVEKAYKNGTEFAVLFIDLDRFKFVNDTLGHHYGDILLTEAAKRIQTSIGNKNLIVRMGGDEFICIIEDLQNDMEAENYAKSIITAFSEPFKLKNTDIFITASIGISLFPYDGDEADILISNADSAMYQAKKKGRNQYEKVRVNESAGAFEKLLLENNLRKALKENELTLYFQPQINLKTNEMNSMEALIRWHHPELGLISPGDFIPIAEETGLILLIDEWVLRTACTKMKERQNAGFPPFRVAVNLSAAQFLQKDLIVKIDQILADTSLDPSYLELEITENMVMHDVKAAIQVLKNLKERGIHLSIDDFGTGYSSLTYLKDLPVDILKIDQSFIKDIDTNSNSSSLTKAIVSLGHDLNLKVIAEGVETNKQLSLMKQQSCDLVQGYIFSKPLNYEQTENYLNTYINSIRIS